MFSPYNPQIAHFLRVRWQIYGQVRFHDLRFCTVENLHYAQAPSIIGPPVSESAAEPKNSYDYTDQQRPTRDTHD